MCRPTSPNNMLVDLMRQCPLTPHELCCHAYQASHVRHAHRLHRQCWEPFVSQYKKGRQRAAEARTTGGVSGSGVDGRRGRLSSPLRIGPCSRPLLVPPFTAEPPGLGPCTGHTPESSPNHL